MYKTILDHRFAAEFDQLVQTRAHIINDVADEAQKAHPARQAKTGLRLNGTGLTGDTHPLQASWLVFDQPRFSPTQVQAEMLSKTLRNRIALFSSLVDEHIANRAKTKQLIAELESAVRKEALVLAWPEGLFALGSRPITEITGELNALLKL